MKQVLCSLTLQPPNECLICVQYISFFFSAFFIPFFRVHLKRDKGLWLAVRLHSPNKFVSVNYQAHSS